ncbi:MAG: zinc ABC transporter ATP-binding protein [Bacteroidetes bacterium GWF2_49_14]|nr:MAG: zinc ABC transporter ATP-binding protein [Bacteroidetes bacterium GWF2_49_14]HBB91801.1 zinc ABC transporter ATP-binding protein [Bacteroidales bacterium]
MEKLIELRDITFGYGTEPVIEKANLEIFKKDFIGMIGPNGGGKSTLIRIILGLLEPWKGIVSVPASVNIGYLPQYQNFDNRFPISVEEVVLSGLLKKGKLTSRVTRDDKLKAREVLEKVGMLTFSRRSIGELSGGQMQRVFIGRALISDPDLLILDEPVTYVDNRFEHELYELLEAINQETAILLVSHDVGQILSSVKTIACVNHYLHYHPDNQLTEQILESYNCPIDLITHGHVPHRVLHTHPS